MVARSGDYPAQRLHPGGTAVLAAESTPQQEIHSRSLLHTYIGTVDSTDRERRADRQ